MTYEKENHFTSRFVRSYLASLYPQNLHTDSYQLFNRPTALQLSELPEGRALACVHCVQYGKTDDEKIKSVVIYRWAAAWLMTIIQASSRPIYKIK